MENDIQGRINKPSCNILDINDHNLKPETKDKVSSCFSVNKHGVFYCNENNESVCVCSPLKITAITRNENQQDFGKLLEWKDIDGHFHEWAMPSEFLACDGRDIFRVLYSNGFQHIENKKLLLKYIKTYPVQLRALCVNKTGWHNGAFVLPDVVIGQKGSERLILQNGESGSNHYLEKGTLEDWQYNVSRHCVGNSRLTFAVSASFAAPLLEWVGFDGMGVNFKGNSSEGKTTALRVAASVCGGNDYMSTWRATSNGLEGTAAHHNDSTLILDEMGQVALVEAGEIVYMLANGMGKVRANRSGNARAKKQWRILLLSSGEISLSDHLASIGKKTKAGQEVRLADIPMNTGKYGGFEVLHDFDSGSELSDHLKSACAQYHGVAFRTYLDAIHHNAEGITRNVKQLQADFISEYIPSDACGQVKRVAGYFALVAAGGELATQLAVTGWEEGEATQCAAVCFKAWLDLRGGIQNSEDQAVLNQVVTFFQKHGQSRFANWDQDARDRENIINRAGFVQRRKNEVIYYVFREQFKDEVCAGFDHKQVAKILASKNMLLQESGKNTVSRTPPGESKDRFYMIKGGIS